MDKKTLKNRILERYPLPICIVGEGLSGRAVKDLFLSVELKESSDFCIYDDKSPSAQYRDPQILLSEFKPKSLIVSPGVPLKTKWIQAAAQTGIKIGSEISIASLVLTTEKIIGVTGSLGKSTTVSLLGAGLKRFSDSGFVGGNLGTPFAVYAKELVTATRPIADWVVLELSSYQLENFEFLPIHHAAITYLSSNHLERYESLEEYYSTKWELIRRCRETCVINGNGGDLQRYANQHPPTILVQVADQHHSALSTSQFKLSKLVGRHNWDNLAVAYAVAKNCGWPDFCVQGLLDFAGLSHRMEHVGVFNGVRAINDSKATTMESVLTASEALLKDSEENSQIYLLLGGRDKKLPWEELSTLAKHPRLEFLFFGECASLAQEKSGLKGPIHKTLKEAVTALSSQCKRGDTILLSPGGSSLDEFKNFEERGTQFTAYLKELFK